MLGEVESCTAQPTVILWGTLPLRWFIIVGLQHPRAVSLGLLDSVGSVVCPTTRMHEIIERKISYMRMCDYFMTQLQHQTVTHTRTNKG